MKLVAFGLTGLVTVVAAAVLAGVVLAGPARGADTRDFGGGLVTLHSDIRTAVVSTIRFHSVQQAVAEGYLPGSPCIASPAGGMGIHYENAALMADPAVDPARPEMLLYEPDATGSLRLVGLEYWKSDADGNLATSDDRPSLFGRPFDGPMPGHSPVMPVHYDLHVWIWKSNPSGLFAEFNPRVSCP